MLSTNSLSLTSNNTLSAKFNQFSLDNNQLNQIKGGEEHAVVQPWGITQFG